MKNIHVIVATICTLCVPSAYAAVSDDEIAELRRQLVLVSQRLDELAEENARLKAAQDETATAVTAVSNSIADIPGGGETWPDRIRMDGDFRYRFETIDVEGSEKRTRHRIRARSNIKAKVSDTVDVGFGLATGGDDPVSTNQTLGGGGSSKGVVLNLAYADWQATDGLNLIGGKFKNPLFRAGKQPLTWDGDWTPEGIGIKYERDWFFANAIGTYLEGDSRKDNKNFSSHLQFLMDRVRFVCRLHHSSEFMWLSMTLPRTSIISPRDLTGQELLSFKLIQFADITT